MQLKVIFSNDPFNKPILTTDNTTDRVILPKSLTKDQFEKWFNNNRIYNPIFFYKTINLEIIKDWFFSTSNTNSVNQTIFLDINLAELITGLKF